MRTWVRRIAVLVGVLLAAAAVLAIVDVRRQLPDQSTPRIPGLGAKVEVTFDARGIPTVRARSLADALRVEGYLQARERLFQMELARRVAGGEVSALVGASGAPARPAPAGLRVRHGGRGGGAAPSARGARRCAGARRRHQRLHRLAPGALGARVPAARARAPALDAGRLHPGPAPHAPAAVGELGARADGRGPRRAPRRAPRLPPPRREHRRRAGRSGRRAPARTEHRGAAHPRGTSRDPALAAAPARAARGARRSARALRLGRSARGGEQWLGPRGRAHRARQAHPGQRPAPRLHRARHLVPDAHRAARGRRRRAAVDPGREPPRASRAWSSSRTTGWPSASPTPAPTCRTSTASPSRASAWSKSR